MRHSRSEFDVLFEGLKLGKHVYDFQIDDTFFADIDYTLVEKADITVHFELDKKETMMVGMFEIKGVISGTCDRCTDEVFVDIVNNFDVVLKFSDEISDDENLIHIPSNEHAIKLKPILYEFINVMIPSRMLHKENECNQEMLRLIEQYSQKEEKETDPRWEALRKNK